MTAQNFNRRISAEEALILATAGDGSKTEGFRNLLDLYQELHNMGYRCNQRPKEVICIETGEEFASISIAETTFRNRGIKVSGSHITSVCKGRRKIAGGYSWKYKLEFL